MRNEGGALMQTDILIRVEGSVDEVSWKIQEALDMYALPYKIIEAKAVKP